MASPYKCDGAVASKRPCGAGDAAGPATSPVRQAELALDRHYRGTLLHRYDITSEEDLWLAGQKIENGLSGCNPVDNMARGNFETIEMVTNPAPIVLEMDQNKIPELALTST